MTSGHVVIPSIEDNKVPVTASGPPFDEIVTLEVVAQNLAENADFALLRFKKPSVVADIAALDVSTRLPDPDEEFLSLGWGQEPDEDKPLAGRPVFVTYQNDGTIRFREEASGKVPGDSGSPLIDSYGMVIGTLESRLTILRSHYVSIRLAAPALLELTDIKRANDFGAMILSGDLAGEVLVSELDPNDGDLRNFHLVSWARQIRERADEYRRHTKLFKCPIVPAYNDRGLSRIANHFLEIAPTPVVDRARQFQREAKNDDLVADKLSAGANLVAANRLYQQAIRNFGRKNTPSMELIDCRLEHFNDAECSDSQGSTVLAAMYRDWSLVLFNAASIAQDANEREEQLERASDAGQRAILATADAKSVGLSYTVVGDVLLELGMAEKAAGAYAAAYSNGLHSPWVVTNYAHSSRLIQDPELAHLYLDRGIQEAPNLTIDEIARLSGEQGLRH